MAEQLSWLPALDMFNQYVKAYTEDIKKKRKEESMKYLSQKYSDLINKTTDINKLPEIMLQAQNEAMQMEVPEATEYLMKYAQLKSPILEKIELKQEQKELYNVMANTHSEELYAGDKDNEIFTKQQIVQNLEKNPEYLKLDPDNQLKVLLQTLSDKKLVQTSLPNFFEGKFFVSNLLSDQTGKVRKLQNMEVITNPENGWVEKITGKPIDQKSAYELSKIKYDMERDIKKDQLDQEKWEWTKRHSGGGGYGTGNRTLKQGKEETFVYTLPGELKQRVGFVTLNKNNEREFYTKETNAKGEVTKRPLDINSIDSMDESPNGPISQANRQAYETTNIELIKSFINDVAPEIYDQLKYIEKPTGGDLFREFKEIWNNENYRIRQDPNLLRRAKEIWRRGGDVGSGYYTAPQNNSVNPLNIKRKEITKEKSEEQKKEEQRKIEYQKKLERLNNKKVGNTL